MVSINQVETKTATMKSPTQKKSAVRAFNDSSNKLGKLPSLVKYIAANMEKNDYVIEIHSEAEVSPSQWRVIRCFYGLTREERRAHFGEIAMYMFMRYEGFSVEESARDEQHSKGINIRIK